MTQEVLNGGAPAQPSESATPEAAQVNAATTEAPTGGAEGGDQGQVQEKTFTQKELDEILQKRLAKAERKAEQRVLRTLERVIPQQPSVRQETQEEGSDRPTRREGEADDIYLERLADWKLDQRDKKAAQERQQQQAKTLSEKTERIYADAEKLPGFDRDAFDELPLSRAMVEALIDSDNAAKLMHHMASNPEEVERIAKLSPARQAAELGKLEASLPKTPKASKAPDPSGDPAGRATTTTVPTDPGKMTHEQYRAWRQKQGARWAN